MAKPQNMLLYYININTLTIFLSNGESSREQTGFSVIYEIHLAGNLENIIHRPL